MPTSQDLLIFIWKDKCMRTSREVSQSTKNKISQAVKKSHLRKTETEKQQWRSAISAGQKRAWAAIPKQEEDKPEMDYATDW